MADDDDDGKRASEVLQAALRLVETSWIPEEVASLILLLDERLNPSHAVVCGYLLGYCRGDIEKLKAMALEFKKDEAASLGERR